MLLKEKAKEKKKRCGSVRKVAKAKMNLALLPLLSQSCFRCKQLHPLCISIFTVRIERGQPFILFGLFLFLIFLFKWQMVDFTDIQTLPSDGQNGRQHKRAKLICRSSQPMGGNFVVSFFTKLLFL